jgi:hypothetical protein
MFLQDLLGFVDRALHRVVSRSQYDLRAVSAQKVQTLNAHVFGHRQDDFVSLRCRNHRETDTCVTAGRFDDRSTRLELAGALCRFDHAQTDAVLHAAAGIEELQLREHFRPTFLRNSVEPNDGCLPDDLANVSVNSVMHDSYRTRFRILAVVLQPYTWLRRGGGKSGSGHSGTYFS